MFIYILLALFGYFFAFLELSTNKKNRNEKLLLFFAYIFFSVLLTLLQGLRGEVGNDYLGYKQYYESTDVINSNYEFGFKYLVCFFKFVNINYNLFQFIMAIITGGIFYSYIYKKTRYPFFFLFAYFCIFFFPVNFSQLRQQIAISVLMLFSLINKKNSKIITIIALVLAATFHRTCLILVTVPLMRILMKKKSKTILFILFCITILFMLYAKVFFEIIQMLKRLTVLPPLILNILYYYTEEMNNVGIGAGVYASFFLCIIIIFFSDENYKNTFYFVIAFILDKAGFFVVVIQRFSYYFYFNKLGLESYSNVAINKRVKGYTKLLAIFLLLTYLFLINLKYLVDAGSYIIPYRFF